MGNQRQASISGGTYLNRGRAATADGRAEEWDGARRHTLIAADRANGGP
jgi:hypothetical protein